MTPKTRAGFINGGLKGLAFMIIGGVIVFIITLLIQRIADFPDTYSRKADVELRFTKMEDGLRRISEKLDKLMVDVPISYARKTDLKCLSDRIDAQFTAISKKLDALQAFLLDQASKHPPSP